LWWISLRGRGRGTQSYDKSIVECYYYHKLGHYQFECPSKEKKANFTKTQKKMLLMTYMDNNQAIREDVWFLTQVIAIICVARRSYSLILIKVSDNQ